MAIIDIHAEVVSPMLAWLDLGALPLTQIAPAALAMAILCVGDKGFRKFIKWAATFSGAAALACVCIVATANFMQGATQQIDQAQLLP